MKTSATVRKEIETALEGRVAGALSPQVRAERVRLTTGVGAVDALAGGGFPVGAITELVGGESSGRTTLAVSFAARRAGEGAVFAWVDVTDSADPESMAAAGVDLERMLWVRCGEGRGVPVGQVMAGVGVGAAMLDRTISAPSLGGGCGSPHPRSEGRGMPQAIGGLMSGLAGELMGESRGATKSQPGGNRALLPAKRRDKWIGTPSAPNRSEEGESNFSWRSVDREEQVATDRRPARRGDVVMSGKTGGWEPRCAEGVRDRREGKSMPAERWASSASSGPALAPGGARGSELDQGNGTERAYGGSRTRAGGMQELREARYGNTGRGGRAGMKARPWSAMEQALRAADMLLQAGGFGVVVLDLGGVAAEAVWKIPMATWFRFRAAAERSQTCLVLLTQYACARSSAELVLEMGSAEMQAQGRVMTGVSYGAKVGRQRFM